MINSSCWYNAAPCQHLPDRWDGSSCYWELKLSLFVSSRLLFVPRFKKRSTWTFLFFFFSKKNVFVTVQSSVTLFILFIDCFHHESFDTIFKCCATLKLVWLFCFLLSFYIKVSFLTFLQQATERVKLSSYMNSRCVTTPRQPLKRNGRPTDHLLLFPTFTQTLQRQQKWRTNTVA